MTKQNHRPKVLPESARVETTVPTDVSEAIDALAQASGVSKYAFVRNLLFAGLEPFAVADPELAAKIPATSYTRSTE